MGLLFLLLTGVVVVDIWYVWINDSKLNSALFMILLLIAFLILAVITYYFPLLSRFDKRNLEMLKMSAIVAFRYLPLTLCILIVFVISVIGIYLMPWAILVIPGVYLYLLSFPMEYVLRKLMPVVEEGSEEAEKWYYQ